MRASCVVLRVIATARRSYRRSLGSANHEGRVLAAFIDQTWLKRVGSRSEHDKHNGRSDRRPLFAAMVFLPLLRRQGEGYARRTTATGRADIILDEDVRGSNRGL
jgi:hypothetical protein